jgi:hypothetical protein
MRLAFWALAICVWLASAVFSQQVVGTLFMFGGLDHPTLQVRLILWAPVVALGVFAVVAIVRRKAVWLPATLLLSPALQAAGLVMAKLDPVT